MQTKDEHDVEQGIRGWRAIERERVVCYFDALPVLLCNAAICCFTLMSPIPLTFRSDALGCVFYCS